MASNTISFPERRMEREVPAVAAVAAETSFRLIMFPATPGVHIMDPSTMPALRNDHTDHARAIVAQVEWELAQQAARKKLIEFHKPAAEPDFPRDTPWSVLRRVMRFLRHA